jgi:hypothetical protein
MAKQEESRLNVMIPVELRQDITDIAFLTKGFSEKQLVVLALQKYVATLKDAGGEKIANALATIREAREV